MIGIDTNILVRYLVRDDPRQTAIADRWLEKHCLPEEPGWVSAVVVCELVWVLQSGYGYAKPEVVQILRQLSQTEELELEHTGPIHRAIDDFAEGKADFSYYLIARCGQRRGVSRTITLDRKASGHALFQLAK